MSSPQLLIRTDVSSKIGTGHLMRCLALAEWAADREIHSTLLLSAAPAPALQDLIRSKGVDFAVHSFEPVSPQDAAATIAKAQELHANWLVVDGYQFTSDFQHVLKSSGRSLLVFDDYGHCSKYSADFVLNQNVYASVELYPDHEPDTRLLLGPQYMILRKEFLRWKNTSRKRPGEKLKILVTLGGADPGNATGQVLAALQLLADLPFECRVAVGAANPHLDSIRALCATNPAKFELKSSFEKFSDEMTWADLAIAAGGTTAYEMAFMGLPALLIVLADNQVRVAEALAALGAATNLGRAENLAVADLASQLRPILAHPEKLGWLSQAARNLVDGMGAARVLDAMAASRSF